jgi:hypothetical protein
MSASISLDGLSHTSITDNGTETRYLWCGEEICAARIVIAGCFSLLSSGIMISMIYKIAASDGSSYS